MKNKIIVVFQLLEYQSCDKNEKKFLNVSSNRNFKFSLSHSLSLSLVEIGGEALSCQPEDRGSNTEFKLTSCRPTKTREAIGRLAPRLSGRPRENVTVLTNSPRQCSHSFKSYIDSSR